MRNVLLILKRDITRLLHAPSALVVVIALFVFPSLYAWYNIAAFWNPYENTSEVRVCVVNEDAGANSELVGSLNLGTMIEEELANNNNLDWTFDAYGSAMSDLEKGQNFAVLVIPSSFSSDMLTIVSGNFKQPAIQYYVNEKTGPVVPKITDAATGIIGTMINATFVSTVSDVVVKTLGQAIEDVQTAEVTANSDAMQLTQGAIDDFSNARKALSAVKQKVDDARTSRANIDALLARAQHALNVAQTDLTAMSTKMYDVQIGLEEVSVEASTAIGEAIAALSALKPIAEEAGCGEELQATIDSLQHASGIMFKTMIPQVSSTLGTLGKSGATLAASAATQQMLIDQTSVILDQIDTALVTASSAIDATDALIGGLQTDLRVVQTDLGSLSISKAMNELTTNGTINADSIVKFMASPTTVTTEKFYEMNSFGTGMAPLFISLTLWIGGFMVLVVMKLEVDSEGIKRLTVQQRYLSRYLLFAIIAIAQALVCAAGSLLLGVQVVSVLAFAFAMMVCSLAFLSITYALSVMFQHVGMGLCIILVFLQIPAATGLYPMELTAPFYQAISPFIPFTYATGALREAIFGFYGATYAKNIAVLLLFFVVFLVLGLTLHPLFSNVNRTFAKQIKESGIFNGEEVEVPERRMRLSQIFSALYNTDEFYEDINRRYQRFISIYPKLLRWTAIVGVGVPIVLGIVFSLTVGEKAALLGLWLLWIVVLFIFLSVVENMRNGFEQQLELSGMTPEDLRDLYESRQEVSGAVSFVRARAEEFRVARGAHVAPAAPDPHAANEAHAAPDPHAAPEANEAPAAPAAPDSHEAPAAPDPHAANEAPAAPAVPDPHAANEANDPHAAPDPNDESSGGGAHA